MLTAGAVAWNRSLLDLGPAGLRTGVRAALQILFASPSREPAQMKRLSSRSWPLGPMLKSRPSVRPTRRVSAGDLWPSAAGRPPGKSQAPRLPSSGRKAVISPLGAPSPVSGGRCPQESPSRTEAWRSRRVLTGSGRESTQAPGAGRAASRVCGLCTHTGPRVQKALCLHALLSPSCNSS